MGLCHPRGGPAAEPRSAGHGEADFVGRTVRRGPTAKIRLAVAVHGKQARNASPCGRFGL